jgi:hypothetical protein
MSRHIQVWNDSDGWGTWCSGSGALSKSAIGNPQSAIERLTLITKASLELAD